MPRTRRVYTCHMPAKTARIHLRIADEDKKIFEHASALYEESLTDFLVKGGRERAERMLADRTAFPMPEQDWQTFAAALDRPARFVPEVAKLFDRDRPE